MVQERRRHGCRRRTIVRGVHRQSGHRGSLADCGNADRNPCAGWRNGSCWNGDCGGRCGKRCCRGTGTGSGASSCIEGRTYSSTGTSTSTESRTCSGTRACSEGRSCSRTEGCTCTGACSRSRTSGSSKRVKQFVVVASGAPSRERPRHRRGTTRRYRPWRPYHARRRARLHRCTRADTSSCCTSCCAIARACTSCRAGASTSRRSCSSTRAGCCTVTSRRTSTSRCTSRCYRCARRSRCIVEDSPSHRQSHDRQ